MCPLQCFRLAPRQHLRGASRSDDTLSSLTIEDFPMSVANSPPPSHGKRIGCTVLWLAALALLWAAPILTRRFGMMLMLAIVLTYVLTWGRAITISRNRRLTVFRGLLTTMTLLIILACLEVPAALNLVDWGGIFRRMTGDEDYYDSAYVSDPELGYRRRPNEHYSWRP